MQGEIGKWTESNVFFLWLQDPQDHLCTSVCSNQVEAEVIVHSERSDTGREKTEDGEREHEVTTPSGPSLSEGSYSPLSSSSPPVGEGEVEEAALQKLAPAHSPASRPSIKPAANRNGTLRGPGEGTVGSADSEPLRDGGLTNGFHSPRETRCAPRLERTESRDTRHCVSTPEKSPAPFVSSGLVHSSSAAHTYLCP